VRVAVVSPFVDKQHGTERALTELLDRLARDYGVEIHLYAQRATGLPFSTPSESSNGASRAGKIFWHKVSAIPGPHLLQFVWWYFANRFARWRDLKFRRVVPDLIYSPCINSVDAKAITVHIVFHAFYEQVRPHLRITDRSPLRWPVMIHRLLYYRLIMALERRVYTNPQIALSAISNMVSNQLEQFFGRSDSLVARYGVDSKQFNSKNRVERRGSMRAAFYLKPE
jgi:hypothetical protein